MVIGIFHQNSLTGIRTWISNYIHSLGYVWVIASHTIQWKWLFIHALISVNSLWPSDVIWWHRSVSTLAQVMACCLTAPSHYLNQCWLIISEVLWHSPFYITSFKSMHLRLLSHLPGTNGLISVSKSLFCLDDLQMGYFLHVFVSMMYNGTHYLHFLGYQRCPDSKVHGPTWGPPGADRTLVGPILAPWTLLSGCTLFQIKGFRKVCFYQRYSTTYHIYILFGVFICLHVFILLFGLITA